MACQWWEQALSWEQERRWPARLHQVAGGDAGPRFWWWRRPPGSPAAEIAVDLRQGKDIKSVADTTATSGSGDSVPAKLLTAVSVTKANIKDAIGTDALYTTAQLCNGPFTQPCKHAGIQ
ncbi:hypothetical protein [Actinacidiphila oryziradicis]|uniref:Uncharacterized protein n=1 Tax=Actinacidiphila oryziradicis TaxID=2571141 RepID=A0A4U0RWT9_9ACTN|nr:hypothetical protein [Actinacidiphila oryziradicis]TJZ99280.1 hypothetical protein FCI23_46505 [Actinacidiphila oryziradicis]